MSFLYIFEDIQHFGSMYVLGLVELTRRKTMTLEGVPKQFHPGTKVE